MTNTASTEVSDVTHQAKGVESLTPNQRDLLAQAFGFSPASGYNLLGKAELPSKLQNAINDMVTHGDSVYFMSQDSERQTLFADAFGLRTGKHTNEIEERRQVAAKLSELVTR